MCFASLGKRLVEAVFIIFCIITINFILIRFMPGDPVVHIIGEDEYLRLEAEAPEVIEEVRREYGLDKPLPVQYITYLNKTLHLDFGNSYRTKLPVLETVLFRMRWTLLLTIPAIVLSSVLGGGLGLRAGWKKGGLLDTIASESPSLTRDESTRLFYEVEKDYLDIKSKIKRFQEIRENPHFNAVQVKFSYAVTCHKAQGGQWRAVFIDRCLFGDEPMTRDMLRWLYTALTRATDKLYLVNFDDQFYE